MPKRILYILHITVSLLVCIYFSNQLPRVLKMCDERFVIIDKLYVRLANIPLWAWDVKWWNIHCQKRNKTKYILFMLGQLAMQLQIFPSRESKMASGTEYTFVASFFVTSKITIKTKQCRAHSTWVTFWCMYLHVMLNNINNTSSHTEDSYIISAWSQWPSLLYLFSMNRCNNMHNNNTSNDSHIWHLINITF